MQIAGLLQFRHFQKVFRQALWSLAKITASSTGLGWNDLGRTVKWKEGAANDPAFRGAAFWKNQPCEAMSRIRWTFEFGTASI
jgi:hypothetical protein